MYSGFLKRIIEAVDGCYANNSKLYKYFSESASLKEIVDYLYWDYQQPEFKGYLERWRDKAPQYIKSALEEHIKEEDGHGKLFSGMMKCLLGHCDANRNIDYERLKLLNYTFSKECALKESFEFFCGGFFATERMAAKRYGQLVLAFERLQIPPEDYHFIRIHSNIEPAHSIDVLEQLVKPLTTGDQKQRDQILNGINDRTRRSEDFLRWYEKEKCKKGI